MKHFIAIAAMSENRVIGEGDKIPWHLPEDFQWFRKTTIGHIVLMGRKTFEGLGKPLPNRTNFILSRHPRRVIKAHPHLHFREWRGGDYVKSEPQLSLSKIGIRNDELFIFNSLKKVCPAEFPKQIYICGGAQIYEQTLPMCSDLYLTHVKRKVPGDAFFPPFEEYFKPFQTIKECTDFKIVHYRHRSFKS